MNQPNRFRYKIGLGVSRGRVAGFSLVELMITLVIAAFLISALILTFLSGRVAATDAEQLARMQENIRIISEYLVRDVRNAGYVDEVEILVGHDDLMRRSFAEIEDANTLRVRYAGRGHCGEQFDEFVLVENEYSVNDGVLQCRGRHVPGTTSVPPGANWESVLTGERTVQLLSGIDSVEFIRLNPVDIANCDFDYSPANIESSCVGIQINVGLVGPRGDIRELSLVSAFRNIILDRLNNQVPAPI